jgi:hypothetical protein
MTSIFYFGFIAPVGATLVGLQRRPKFSGTKDEWFAKRLWFSIPTAFAVTQLPVCLVVAFTESLLEEHGDAVGDPLQLFITFSLCCFETASYMSSNERHGDSVIRS